MSFFHNPKPRDLFGGSKAYQLKSHVLVLGAPPRFTVPLRWTNNYEENYFGMMWHSKNQNHLVLQLERTLEVFGSYPLPKAGVLVPSWINDCPIQEKETAKRPIGPAYLRVFKRPWMDRPSRRSIAKLCWTPSVSLMLKDIWWLTRQGKLCRGRAPCPYIWKPFSWRHLRCCL